jgi:hypothetical protein
MDDGHVAVARRHLDRADTGALTVPEIVAALNADGCESSAIDFRRAAATYYRADGDSVELPGHRVASPVAAVFDPERPKAAIREAQQLVPGYT